MEHRGLEPAPMWDASAIGRTLAYPTMILAQEDTIVLYDTFMDNDYIPK